MSVQKPTLTIIASALAVLAYNTWVLAWWLNPELSVYTPLVSELASVGQPHAFFFRCAEITTVVLLIPATIAISRLKVRFSKVILVNWVLTWVCTVIDTFFPMECAIAGNTQEMLSSAQCRGYSTLIHETSSILVGVFSIVAVLLLSLVNIRNKQNALSLAMHISGGIYVLTTAYAASALSILPFLSGAGWAQRISVIAFSLWWVFVVLLADRGVYFERKYCATAKPA